MKESNPGVWIVTALIIIGAIVLLGNIFWFLSSLIMRIVGIAIVIGLVVVGYGLIKNRK